jgi:hypothetical protein
MKRSKNNKAWFAEWQRTSAVILARGGRAQRRHRFSDARSRNESGVALRFPPQSKINTAKSPCHAGVQLLANFK